MRILTTNQVNQVYVVNAVKTDTIDDQTSEVTAKATLESVGDILVRGNKDGQIYFQHKGAGGITRSDLIDVKNIMWARSTKAADLATPLKAAKLEINSAALASSKPIVGEDYVLRIEFDQVFGLSEDSKYLKFGVVHVYNNMSASDFYKTLALSIVKNMAREETEIIKVKIGSTYVTKDMKITDITGTASNILIETVEPDWILGLKQQIAPSFKLVPSTVKDANGTEIIWGDVTYSDGVKYTGGSFETANYSHVSSGLPTGGTILDGKAMADYEYFYMGERADQYRLSGWPNYVPTTYLVNPSQEYDTIGIHFAFTDSNESVQKSEKDITLIVLKGQTASVITAINAAIQAAGGASNVVPSLS